MEKKPNQRLATRKEVPRVTVRFAGDSGDGMQLVGSMFSTSSAILGNDISTLPDFPAEIRAPAGSLPGVSAFQICFASEDIHTPGDRPDVLVAMNPAALKANLGDLQRGGTIIVNTDEFTPTNLKKAGYETSPTEDDSLDAYRVFHVPIMVMTHRALEDTALDNKQKNRSKNFFALGLMYWLYGRPLDAAIERIEAKFKGKGELANANKASLKAGHAFGETAEMFTESYAVPAANLEPGFYRNITGNAASALGFLAASQICGRPLFYGSYPITPASEILHELSRYKNYGVRTFQAEDEIAAVGSTIGAAFGGALALTGTSGPGVALKSEAIGMAVMTELPIVVVNVQRAGPSTGMPTKTEQSDLLQAVYGRSGESPLAVVAPATPGDCFDMAIEACRIALQHMVPVIYLSDGYLANSSEPWKVPAVESLLKFSVEFATDPEGFMPYARDEKTLARPWAVPGTPGLEHRLGTLEKAHLTGHVSYDPDNHQKMSELRAEKVARIADAIGPQVVFGADEGDLLVLGWGSTYGAIRSAVKQAQDEGISVSHAHLRYICPFPHNLGKLLRSFRHVLIPELNLGQLRSMIRATFLIDAQGLNKVAGRPLSIGEVYDAITANAGQKQSRAKGKAVNA